MNLQIINDCGNQPRITGCGDLPWWTIFPSWLLPVAVMALYFVQTVPADMLQLEEDLIMYQEQLPAEVLSLHNLEPDAMRVLTAAQMIEVGRAFGVESPGNK